VGKSAVSELSLVVAAPAADAACAMKGAGVPVSGNDLDRVGHAPGGNLLQQCLCHEASLRRYYPDQVRRVFSQLGRRNRAPSGHPVLWQTSNPIALASQPGKAEAGDAEVELDYNHFWLLGAERKPDDCLFYQCDEIAQLSKEVP